MKRVLVHVAFAAVVAATVFVVGGFGDQLPYWRWARGGTSPWVTHERSALTAVVVPGHLLLRAQVDFADVREDQLAFLLNKGLSVREARVGGTELDVDHGLALGSRYHDEGRLVIVHLPGPPVDGRISLDLLIHGEAEQGEEGSDWRGILYVGESEVRLSEQTNWHPQVPTSTEGPGKRRVPSTLDVLAPPAWELFAPGRQEATGAGPIAPDHPLLELFPPRVLAETLGRAADQPLRHWRFVSERPSHPNLVGGLRQRASVTVGDTRVLTLLRDEHADLGPRFVELGAEVLTVLGEAFGQPATGSLCVFEQTCRSDSSYNWAAESLVVFDRHALGLDVPVRKLAHEIGHLWWGQSWTADGPGERFLTEGGAEASALLFLDGAAWSAELGQRLEWTRRRVRDLAQEGDSLALRAVTFASDDYQTLAYLKGALVHRYVWGSLAADDRAAFFAALGARGREPLTLAAWREALATVDRGLAVPWLDHDGELAVGLDGARHDGAADRVELTVTARPLEASPDFPARVRTWVQVSGRGFVHELPLDLEPGTTTHVVDLSDVRPWTPAGRRPEELRGPDGGLVVHAVTLDPRDLLPGGIVGEGAVVLDGPRLVSSEPAQGARVAWGLTEARLTFDRPVEPFDVEGYRAARVAAAGGRQVPEVVDVAWSDDRRTATFRFRPLAPDTRFELPLRGAVLGAWGEPPGSRALAFETGPSDDDQPPRVVSIDPPRGTTGVPLDLDVVTVTFDEVMQRGVGFDGSRVRELEGDGHPWPEMDFARWDDERRVLTIPFTEPLRPGTTYRLPIGRPLKDLSGNTAAEDEVLFTTADG